MGEYKDKIQRDVKDVGGKVTGDKKMEWGQKAKGRIEGTGNWVRREMTKPPKEPTEPTAPLTPPNSTAGSRGAGYFFVAGSFGASPRSGAAPRPA